MAKFPTLQVLAWGIAGWGLRFVSGVLEMLGDTAIDKSARLTNHIAALIVLAGAMVCFGLALRTIWRWLRGDAPAPKPQIAVRQRPAEISADSDSDFDPDAALERYMKRRAAAEPLPAPPARPWFGRKQP